MKPKLSELLEPIKMNCAKCGAQGTAYPYPWPTGTFYCPKCSPFWLESFLQFATKNLKEEMANELP